MTLQLVCSSAYVSVMCGAPNCKVHTGKRRRGSTRSGLLPWGNLQVALQTVKQRGSGKGVKKPDKSELLTDCIVDVGLEAYKAFSLHSMSCQDVMRWMGPTKCCMCLSQEAILNWFPTDGDCFMDVTRQMDSSIKWEFGKGKGERKGLVNFFLSRPCTWIKYGVQNDLKDPSSVRGHVLTQKVLMFLRRPDVLLTCPCVNFK